MFKQGSCYNKFKVVYFSINDESKRFVRFDSKGDFNFLLTGAQATGADLSAGFVGSLGCSGKEQ